MIKKCNASLDTVKITLHDSVDCDLSKCVYLKPIFNRNTGIRSELYKLDNLSIMVNDGFLKIEGSLPKFYLGNNFDSIEIGEIKEAIEKIEDTLKVILKGAFVKRLDVAKTLIMDNPIECYYPYFGSYGTTLLTKHRNSRYYNLIQKTLIFYDKIKESKVIPEHWKGLFLLRYELRFLKAIHKQFKRSSIYVEDLYCPEFHSQYCDSWRNEFEKIHFIDLQLPESITTPTELDKWIRGMGIEAVGGYDKIMEVIDSINFEDRTQKYRTRKKIKELSQSDVMSNSLVQELKSKVFSN